MQAQLEATASFLSPIPVLSSACPPSAVFSRYLTDFFSVAHAFIDRVPEVEGRAFGELYSWFPGEPVAVRRKRPGYCKALQCSERSRQSLCSDHLTGSQPVYAT